tara:strand:- start:433 stop:699 length:267 start_codon:yes stop_codon:yes gene_type:complete
MKKITLSVAALTIAMMSYGQSKLDSIMEMNLQIEEQNHQLDELIDAIKMDMFYGHLERARGAFYVNKALEIKQNNYIKIAMLTRNENE